MQSYRLKIIRVSVFADGVRLLRTGYSTKSEDICISQMNDSKLVHVVNHKYI